LTGILRTRKNISITLSDTFSKAKLEPLVFSGVPFSKSSIRTWSGKEIKLDIYIQPTGTEDDVEISTKGKVVVREIIRLPEFQHEPWSDGVLHGMIEANFLDVAPTRSDYIRNESFNEFVEAIIDLEQDLNEEINETKEEKDKEKRTRNFKKIKCSCF